MRAIVFDIDHTVFSTDAVLHDGVIELLSILRSLGLQVGAISGGDHRALVRLDEAGIRQYFHGVLCSDHIDTPKAVAGVYALTRQLGVEPRQVVLVSRAHADILLGKEAGVAKTVGVSHGMQHDGPLREAGADHVVSNIPAILDVLE